MFLIFFFAFRSFGVVLIIQRVTTSGKVSFSLPCGVGAAVLTELPPPHLPLAKQASDHGTEAYGAFPHNYSPGANEAAAARQNL